MLFLSPKWEIHDSGHGLNGFSIQPTTIRLPKHACTYAYVVIYIIIFIIIIILLLLFLLFFIYLIFYLNAILIQIEIDHFS